MQVNNVCSLQNLTISEAEIRFGINGAELYGAQRKPDITPFDDGFLYQVGAVKYNSFVNKPFFLASVELDDSLDKDSFALQHMEFRTILSASMRCLWFAKDNAASVLDAYSTVPSKPEFFLISHMGAGSSKADGTFDKTELTIDDFNIAIQVYIILTGFQSQDYERKNADFPVGEQRVFDSAFHYGNHSKTNRLERCITFLSLARGNSYLPLKISFYIAVLECLFTTDDGEITHKVAERTGKYIGGDIDSKLYIFKFIKRAYGIRSAFFHGSAQRKNHSSTDILAEISVELDEILRQVLRRAFLKDREIFLDTNKDLLRAFCESLIFQP